jgi:lipoate-protein ligase A
MHLLDVSLPSPEENLALDEALLRVAEARDESTAFQGESAAEFVRVWECQRYAVVLGRSRRVQADVHVENCTADGVAIVRRASGGGTVLLGPGCVNLTFVLRYDRAPVLQEVRRSVVYVMSCLQRCLAGAGRPVRCAGLGDLVLGDRKCGGSAQRRLQNCFMHQVSLLCRLDIDRMTQYLREPDRQPDYRHGRRHREFVVNLDVEPSRLRESLLAGLAREMPDLRGLVPASARAGLAQRGTIDPRTGDLMARLVRERYGRADWNLSL